MKSPEIRKRFFDYFTKHNHTQVASSSLIPAQDPTLLFANAGMNQFKDCFLGKEQRSYTRAVTIQKCVRAGGKHNDLDNVGFTKRHLTFFEMMGNFSFGDYFKKEAIKYAWEFLTKEMKIDSTHLYATVFTTDDESYDLWHNMIGLPFEKIHRLGEKENFWQMGDVGPCGPCTEIHLDRGAAFGCADNTGCGPACDCDRFLEIWNLVFMQYERQANGDLIELTQKGVDTGMGLERLCSVVQNVDSVFHTDLFAPIIKKIEELCGLVYADQPALTQNAFHVLADHIRSSTLLIADGCAPSNDGRGYVLRKIIRRAALFAQKLTDKVIFPELSATVVKHLSTYYPELNGRKELVLSVLASEVEKFSANLIRGQQILERYFKESANNRIITGEQTFKLYDTYGFPLELVILMAHEKGYTVDERSFESYMEEQKKASGKKIKGDPLDALPFDDSVTTEFTGYEELETTSTINGLILNESLVQQVPQGSTCYVIAQKSPFFIVGGGQVPDEGWLTINGHKIAIQEARYANNRIAVRITAPINLTIGQTVTSTVNAQWRTNAMKNHTGTHLLQAALIEVLGNNVKQSGSLVHPDYLRFDFTYHQNVTSEQIKQIEDIVNQKIMANIPVNIAYMPMKEALNHGALAFFGDKYNPENVRMVKVDDFSIELCGGTHVPATGVIGLLKIVEISALSAGHKRIVAVTGPKALELFQANFGIVKTLCQEFAVQKEDLVSVVLKNKEQIKHLETSIKNLNDKIWRAQLPQWQSQIETINGIPFLAFEIEEADAHVLREIHTALMHKNPGFYFTIARNHDRAAFLASVSTPYATQAQMPLFATWLKDKHQLRGGGKAGSLQGGGAKFNAHLITEIKDWFGKNCK